MQVAARKGLPQRRDPPDKPQFIALGVLPTAAPSIAESRKCEVSANDPICVFIGGTEIATPFFAEGFEDTRLTSRGWYDGVLASS